MYSVRILVVFLAAPVFHLNTIIRLEYVSEYGVFRPARAVALLRVFVRVLVEKYIRNTPNTAEIHTAPQYMLNTH